MKDEERLDIEAAARERVRANKRRYKIRHKEKVLASDKAYRATEGAKEAAKTWRKQNRQKWLAKRRAAYAKNSKKIADAAASARSTPEGMAKNDARVKKYTARRREWMAKNPEAAKARSKEWRDKSKLSTRIHRLKKKYGLTLERYNEMLAAQGHRCMICKTDTPTGNGKVFVVDHCHATNKVRKLLCSHCNSGLGHFKDNPWVLEAAANYLRDHGVAT